VTAAVALPPLLALVTLAPAWLFGLAIGLLTVWGLYEVGVMTASDRPALLALAAAAGAVAAVATLLWTPLWVLAAAVVAGMCGLILWVERHDAKKTSPRLFLVILGGLYVGALYPYFALLRNRTGGVALLLLMLAAVMAGDSGAYFVGRAVGRTKLMPAVSPGKTVEGAVAYIVSSVVAACALKGLLGVRWSIGTTAGFAVLIGMMAQCGDLAESALKRLCGVKDSGWLFPGHGGLLDRADSLVFAAVFAYYYSWWLGLAAA
jgi:phosphatidate cytidylyltransferase